MTMFGANKILCTKNAGCQYDQGHGGACSLQLEAQMQKNRERQLRARIRTGTSEPELWCDVYVAAIRAGNTNAAANELANLSIDDYRKALG